MGTHSIRPVCFDHQVSVQITHHVGNDAEDEVKEDRLAESGVPVELTDAQASYAESQEQQVTVELNEDRELQSPESSVVRRICN